MTLKKIAFIIYSLNRGGAERVVSNISKKISEKYDVTIVVFDDKQIAYDYGGKLLNLNCPAKNNFLDRVINVVKRYRLLKQLFDKECFSQVFSFMETANIPTVLANKNSILCVQNNPNNFDKLTKLMMRFFYPRARAVIGVSKAIQSDLKLHFKLNNTVYIYNPVDIKSAVILSKETCEIDYEFILAVGRLHIQKGFDLLIKAFSLSDDINKKIKLVILGEGGKREELIKLSKKLGIAEQVIFYGNVENPFKFYKNAKFFILSSRYEGLPNTLIEALACGCACISTDCPTGPNEIIKNGDNGLLIDINIESISNAMTKLFSNDKLIEDLKLVSCESVKYFDVNKISKQYEGFVK